MAKLLEVTTSKVGSWEWMLDSGLACAQSLSYTVLWPFWALEHLEGGPGGGGCRLGFRRLGGPGKAGADRAEWAAPDARGERRVI